MKNFYSGKKIFLTGHTGFKGSWLSLWLTMLGAKVVGFSLEADKESLFNSAEVATGLEKSIIGDIRNSDEIAATVKNFQPEIILHLAAQPLVRDSYFDPRKTYETNVIGTLNVFEASRKAGSVRVITNITTDKCYENRETDYAYQEEDALGGYDPYSSSKACAEILTSSYRRSFFQKEGIQLASARAGNVIGGGDFSVDRIIPDIFRAIRAGEKVKLRSPNSIRPWQYVLEPLYGYLLLTKNLYEKGEDFAKAYNFGPNKDAEQNVEILTKTLIEKIGTGSYEIATDAQDPRYLGGIESTRSATMGGAKNLHEAGILKLNHSRATKELNWQPKLSFEETLEWTAEWYGNYLEKKSDVKIFTTEQIRKFTA